MSDVPDASAVPAMLRRRLNTLGRGAISQMLKLLPEDEELPMVYCSQHGDIERTLSVLLDLAKDGSVSPKNFSLAVHNAICGVLSIHSGLKGPINAIAAGEQALVPFLLEAAGTLLDYEQVLCIMCDVPLPEVYRTEQSLPQTAYAACFLLGRDKGQQIEIQVMNDNADSAPTMSALQLVQFLSSTDSDEAKAMHNTQAWRLRKT